MKEFNSTTFNKTPKNDIYEKLHIKFVMYRDSCKQKKVFKYTKQFESTCNFFENLLANIQHLSINPQQKHIVFPKLKSA